MVGHEKECDGNTKDCCSSLLLYQACNSQHETIKALVD